MHSRYEASVRPGFHETYSQMFQEPRQEKIRALATPDDKIRAIKQRALILHGRDDKIVPLSASYYLHTLLEHADMHIFGECGHWTQIERKDDFARLVIDFFSK